MPTLDLSGPVGAGVPSGGAAADAILVQQRLVNLGFNWITVDGVAGPNTIRTIKLFQSIKNGQLDLEAPGSDGRVDVGGDTHKWLEAENAPRWMKLPASGTGFVNVEVSEQPEDDHDFGTDWLSETITAAAAKYKSDFLDSHSVSLLTVNDASPAIGGDTTDHAGHETGLSCDLRLGFNQASGSTPAASPPGDFHADGYSQDATRAVLQAFHAQPLFVRARFNDPVLIGEGLCISTSGHDNHVHIDIMPPARA